MQYINNKIETLRGSEMNFALELFSIGQVPVIEVIFN